MDEVEWAAQFVSRHLRIHRTDDVLAIHRRIVDLEGVFADALHRGDGERAGAGVIGLIPMQFVLGRMDQRDELCRLVWRSRGALGPGGQDLAAQALIEGVGTNHNGLQRRRRRAEEILRDGQMQELRGLVLARRELDARRDRAHVFARIAAYRLEVTRVEREDRDRRTRLIREAQALARWAGHESLQISLARDLVRPELDAGERVDDWVFDELRRAEALAASRGNVRRRVQVHVDLARAHATREAWRPAWHMLRRAWRGYAALQQPGLTSDPTCGLDWFEPALHRALLDLTRSFLCSDESGWRSLAGAADLDPKRPSLLLAHLLARGGVRVEGRSGAFAGTRHVLRDGAEGARVFLSYAREDEAIAGALERALGRAGFDVWLDTRDSMPGEEVWDELRDEIAARDAFVVLVSRQSMRRSWVEREVTWASHCRDTGGRPRVIPAILDDVLLDAGSLTTASARLAGLTWVDLRDARRSEAGWAREIGRLIRRLVGKR